MYVRAPFRSSKVEGRTCSDDYQIILLAHLVYGVKHNAARKLSAALSNFKPSVQELDTAVIVFRLFEYFTASCLDTTTNFPMEGWQSTLRTD